MMKRIIFAVCVLILISGCTDNYRPTGSVVNNIIQTDANSIAENLIYQTIADFIPWADVNVSDQLDLNASSTIDWLALNNYPTGCAAGQAVRIIGDTVTCINVGGGAGTTYTSGTPATIEVDFDANTISQNFDGNFHSRFQAVFDSNFNLNTYGSADFNSIYKNSGGGAFYYAGASLILEPDSNKFNVNDANLPFVRSSIYNAGFPIADGNITSVSLSKVIFDANGNIDYNHLNTENPNLTLPTITGQSGKYLTTNGTVLSWGTVSSSSGSCDNNANCTLITNNNAIFHADANINDTLYTNNISSQDNNLLSIKTNGTTQMTILADGNVGIGTSTPFTTLHVVGDLNVSNQIGFGGLLFHFPKGYGTDGQVLTSDGAGTVSWATASGGGGSGTTYTSGTPATIQVNNDANTLSVNFDGNFYSRLNNHVPWADANILSAIRFTQDASCDNNVNCTIKTNNDATFHADANINDTLYTNNISSQDNNLLSIKTNGTTQMTILADGNVGIGDTTPNNTFQIGTDAVFVVDDTTNTVGIGIQRPTTPLYVAGTGFPVATVERTFAGSGGSFFSGFRLYRNNIGEQDGDGTGFVFSLNDDTEPFQITNYAGVYGVATDVSNGSEDGALTFNTMNTGILAEKVRITTNGSVGIGTTGPGSRLEITDTADNNVLLLNDSDGLCEANPESGGLTWSCSSDVSLKSNIVDANKEEVLNNILDARIRKYTIKSNGDIAMGVIAQEYEQMFPGKVKNTTWNKIVGYQDINSVGDESDNNSLSREPIIETQNVKLVEQPSPWELAAAIQALNEKIVRIETETCADKPTWSWC